MHNHFSRMGVERSKVGPIWFAERAIIILGIDYLAPVLSTLVRVAVVIDALCDTICYFWEMRCAARVRRARVAIPGSVSLEVRFAPRLWMVWGFEEASRGIVAAELTNIAAHLNESAFGSVRVNSGSLQILPHQQLLAVYDLIFRPDSGVGAYRAQISAQELRKILLECAQQLRQ